MDAEDLKRLKILAVSNSNAITASMARIIIHLLKQSMVGIHPLYTMTCNNCKEPLYPTIPPMCLSPDCDTTNTETI